MPYKKVPFTTQVWSTWWERNPETGEHVACAGLRDYTWYETVWEDPYEIYHELGEITEMKKRAQESQKKKGKWEPSGEDFFRPYPHLEAQLGDSWYDDGTPREVGKLTIQLQSGGVSLQLTDPDNRSTAFTTAASVREALELLEDALATGKNPWRSWPKHFGKK